jgi:hypothetical protein
MLQSRSQAIRTALQKYNAAAATMHPPKPQLAWDQVIEYAFLSQFDLLRNESREDISQRPWASPAGRLAMDEYFKVKRAREEIQRLNLEIRRFITYIRDEGLLLRRVESEQAVVNPVLSFHIANYRKERERFNRQHLGRLRRLSSMQGFTGTLEPGTSTNAPVIEESAPQVEQIFRVEEEGSDNSASEEEGSDDEGELDEEDVEGFASVVEAISDRDIHVLTAEVPESQLEKRQTL